MDYKEIDKLNQSLLKKILGHPQDFLEAKEKYQEDSEEEHFVFGSMVDIMLTGTKEEFTSKFLVVDDSIKCSEAVKVIVDGVYEELKETIDLPEKLEEFRTTILKHCQYQNYYSNWKDDTRVDNIIKAGSEYFEILKKGKNKTIVSSSEYANATNCRMALLSDPFTRYYCDRKNPDTEFLDKFIIEFTYEEVDIKGELDRVVIDHSLKKIKPIDFKTMGKLITSFESDFWKFRYDFQAATYTLGLTQHPKIQELLDKGYELERFRYIVVEKTLKHRPMIFQLSSKVVETGLVGGEKSNGYVYEGLTQAIMRYKFAVENNAWDYPMEYYQNEGNVLLEL